MDYMKVYEEWLNSPHVDEETKKELLSIRENEKEIMERFYKELEFGTAGLRGILGAGTNRMNIYTVGKATQGLADFIVSKGEEYMKRGVVIAYDVRHNSELFAKTAALILAANGIKAYLFDHIAPTPLLSFSVRRLNTAAGIVITASHNPKNYNGYKVYWEQGSQILDDVAIPVMENIKKLTDFSMIKKISESEALEKGLLEYVGKDIEDEYIEKVKGLAIRDDIDKDVKIVYTPLNGTGNKPVRRVLAERGFKNIFVVPEQENPDPDFKTVGYPNPEDIKAFEYAKKLAENKDADVIIATDPDCDRTAVMVKHKGEYVPLNGNQTGAILIKYIIEGRKEKGTLSEKGMIIKSIVTGDLGKELAEKYGVITFETLTGFKNICGLENELEGKYDFEFGYEESIGYVTGTFVRDKDGVISSMFVSEAAAYYKKQGKTLIDVLYDLYNEIGYYFENNFSIIIEGLEGMAKMKKIMEVYRKEFPKEIGNMKLIRYIDYLEKKDMNLTTNEINETDVPKSNVLRFFFDDGSWYAVRPSGTEPKLKIYIYSKDKDENKSKEKLKLMKDKIMEIINSVE
ncbi:MULTISPECIES: phospho-sugar mutase [unclassified Marinitoga]|uniref:phospho-sugar mutase n=1 Tax=unclassified Marinitoga TaxID=2640159 RepID=UPI00064186B5|nr:MULTISPECIES: phospho-sugar mutase [unclassified Marinitoga]KLO22221.1 phosphoglucomutase [Marinitoga sp. 1155]NUV00164.1 phosphoglucomutase [Marinitoga sp. 1154]